MTRQTYLLPLLIWQHESSLQELFLVPSSSHEPSKLWSLLLSLGVVQISSTPGSPTAPAEATEGGSSLRHNTLLHSVYMSARHCWTTMLTTPALNGSTTPLPTTGTVTIALSSLITTIYHVSHICRYHPVTSDHQPHCHCQCLHLAPDLGLSNVYIYCQISSFLLMIQTRPWSGCGFQTFLSPLLFLFQIFIDNLQLFR